MLGPDLLLDLEQLVTKVEGNLKEAQDRQKSYVDKKIKDKDYQVGEHVYLKVKAKRSSLILGRCGKLAPRFCGPFETMAKKGLVAYELPLPVHIRVHNVFHASLLNIYVYDTNHVIDWSLLCVEVGGTSGGIFPQSFAYIGQERSLASEAHYSPIESALEAL